MAKKKTKKEKQLETAVESQIIVVSDIKRKIARQYSDHLKRDKAERKFGNEVADLKRLIAELEISINELPDGSLRAASIERRDDLQHRLANITTRLPKGFELSVEHYKSELALSESQLVEAEVKLKKLKEAEKRKEEVGSRK